MTEMKPIQKVEMALGGVKKSNELLAEGLNEINTRMERFEMLARQIRECEFDDQVMIEMLIGEILNEDDE